MIDRRAGRALACLSLLALVGCGSGDAEPHPLPPGIDLPVVGTLGRQPAGPGTIVLDVTADGGITLGGEGPLSLVELRDELERLTAGPRWRGPDRSSLKILLVRADAALPWDVAVWIMQTACEPSVGLYRIFFGARARGDATPGAIGWTLPKGYRSPHVLDDVPPRLALTLAVHDGPAAEPEDVLPALRAAAGARPLRDLVLELKAPATEGVTVPTGFVVGIVDVALRVGVRRIRLEGRRPPPREAQNDVEAFLARIAALKVPSGSPTVWVKGRTVDALPPFEPVPSARGRLAHLYGAGVAPSEPRPGGEEDEGGVRLPEPVVTDEEVEEATEVDNDLPYEESLGDEGLADLPFEGPSAPPGARSGAFPSRARDAGRRSDPVEAALTWLAAHQSPDGGWSAAGFGRWCDRKEVVEADRPGGWGNPAHDVGVTGLALSAFLGAGYTNRGRHPHAKTVSRGLRYLKNVQDAEGCFGPRTPGRFVYDHAAAALAMVEAYGMTESPIFKGSAQRALDFILSARNEGAGWGYGVQPGESDTSVTAWMTMPLIVARWINEDAQRRDRPRPLTIDDEAFDGIHAWIDALTDPETGRTGYRERGGRPDRPGGLASLYPPERSESTTAAAVLLRILLGEDPRRSEAVRAGAALLEALPPTWDREGGSIDHVYWYFGTFAMFQVGGQSWQAWRQRWREALLGSQRRDTDACRYLGSWDPVGVWGREGGRVASTALLAMSLEVHYRYARLFGLR